MNEKVEQKEKSKVNKKVLFGVSICFVVLVLVVIICFSKMGKTTDPSKEKAFQIGDDITYMNEVYVCVLQTLLPLELDQEKLSATLEDGRTAEEYYKTSVYEIMEKYKIECLIAKEQGIELTESEKQAVKDDVTVFVSTISGKAMRELQITSDCVEKVMEEQHLAHKLEVETVSDIEVEDLQYCTIYYMMFPKVKTYENGEFVMSENGETPVLLNVDEIEKRKEDAQNARELLLAGEEAEAVAKQYGVEAFSGVQSSLVESFDEPICDWVKELKEGDCSEVKEISSCYAVIKLLSSHDEEKEEQVADDYRIDLENKKISEKMSEWRDKVYGEAETGKTYQAWDKMSLFDFLK